mmetsp:Transcript_28911/g.69494  ORF Transcript_28911/g.69494 Transcript_28911/m.69494 type:complete len:500 (+) Transcript_28911:45-1544(+)
MGDGEFSVFQLENLIIRPPRARYDVSKLGPRSARFGGVSTRRTDFTVMNPRGLRVQCSRWAPETTAAPLPTVIRLHGNASCRLIALQALPLLIPSGIAVVSLDFAGCGNSDGDYVSLGALEQYDVQAVIEHLRGANLASYIALWGTSMGAATALLVARNEPSLAGVVADSAFADLPRLILELPRGHGRNIPVISHIPEWMLRATVSTLSYQVQRKAGFDLYKVAPEKGGPETHVPCLFLHGTGDDFILPSHAEALYQAYAGEKALRLFPGDHFSARPPSVLHQVAVFLHTAFQMRTDQIPRPPPSLEEQRDAQFWEGIAACPFGANTRAPWRYTLVPPCLFVAKTYRRVTDTEIGFLLVYHNEPRAPGGGPPAPPIIIMVMFSFGQMSISQVENGVVTPRKEIPVDLSSSTMFITFESREGHLKVGAGTKEFPDEVARLMIPAFGPLTMGLLAFHSVEATSPMTAEVTTYQYEERRSGPTWVEVEYPSLGSVESSAIMS